MRLDVYDWDLHTAGPLLVFIPGGKTKARQYLVTLLAAAVVVGVMAYWGVPPGSYKVKRQQRLVVQHERAVAQAEEQVKRLRSGGSVGELHRSRVEGARSQLTARQTLLDHERRKLTNTRATLGPLGDGLYWSALVVLAVMGLGFPQLARFERLVIRADGETLRVRHRLRPWAARSLDLGRYTAIAVHAQRLLTYERQSGSTSDHGWAWSVALLPAPGDTGAKALELVCDHEHLLAGDPNKLTRRVRDTAAYFERATGLKTRPAVVTDVTGVGPHGRRTLRSRRHG